MWRHMDYGPEEPAVSDRVRSIQVAPTIAMSVRAATMAAAGRDIISLSLGELDFPTPDHIVHAAHRAAQQGATRYTAPDGMPSLKDAIRVKFERENGLTFSRDEIHVASGCKQVIFNALAATLNPGDDVVVIALYWVSYTDIFSFCGARPVIVQADPFNRFQPDPEIVAAAMTERTR